MIQKFKYFSFIFIFTILNLFIVATGHSQILSPDSILQPDTNRVVRISSPDAIVYKYYSDKALTKLRSEYVYSIDKTDGREKIVVQFYYLNGNKSVKKTYKNYNQKVKQLNTNFTIRKYAIAENGRFANATLDGFNVYYNGDGSYLNDNLPFEEYSIVDAYISWYSNGVMQDSCWLFPTGRKEKVNGGTDANGNDAHYSKAITLPLGHSYEWYESGNLMTDDYYKENGNDSWIFYFDSPDKKIGSIKISKNADKKPIIIVDKSYYENGNLQDSVVHNLETNEEIERYNFFKNGRPAYTKIDLPDFVVFDSYNEDGTVREFNRKVLYNKKWYFCNETHYANGQLSSFMQDRKFFDLHPEYGSLPDSLTHLGKDFYTDGKIQFLSYTLTTGPHYTFAYRRDGSLQQKTIVSSKGEGLLIEYDEKGNFLSQKEFVQKKK